jgi:uncharacterized membrane protein YqjE
MEPNLTILNNHLNLTKAHLVSAMVLSMMTLSIMTLSIMTLSHPFWDFAKLLEVLQGIKSFWSLPMR